MAAITFTAWPAQGRTEGRLAEVFAHTSAHIESQPVIDAVILDGAVIIQTLQPKTVRTFDEYFRRAFALYILKQRRS